MKTILSIILCAVLLLCGCSSLPKDQLATYVADARDLAQFGTEEVLIENPEYRPKLEQVLRGLKALEELETINMASLVTVLQQLPLDKLESSKARVYILGGKMLLRRVGADVDLGEIASLKPIITALREGLEVGLKKGAFTPVDFRRSAQLGTPRTS